MTAENDALEDHGCFATGRRNDSSCARVNTTPPSPRFLQLSDLGPAELLKQQGIASIRCTKLGDAVQDYLQVVTRCAQALSLMISPHSSAVPGAAGEHYGVSRKCAPTIAAGTSAAFFKASPRLGTAGIQIHFHSVLDRQDERAPAFVLRPHRLGLRVAPESPRLAAHQERRCNRGTSCPYQLSGNGKWIAVRSSAGLGFCLILQCSC